MKDIRMSKDLIAIKVENLSKTFKIWEKGQRTIKDSILRFYQQKGNVRKIQALKDINFEVKKGEFFGIIGRNGSGKSTLLKVLMGAYKPDAGSKISIEGKVIRLAMGLGFDGNLSARENIYINGSVLGLSFKKIGLIFQEIIDFSDLHDFVETPVKHYSSGMMAKLKFAIALHAEADIFLMDEIFGGVGDISFQQKSSERFNQSILQGRTIIFVSHGLRHVEKFCDRVMLLNHGDQIAIGKPSEIIPLYKSYFEADDEEPQEKKKNKREEKFKKIIKKKTLKIQSLKKEKREINLLKKKLERQNNFLKKQKVKLKSKIVLQKNKLKQTD